MNFMEIMEAVALYTHLKEHPEVKGAQINKGMPMCKICDKPANQILKELVNELNIDFSYRPKVAEEKKTLSDKVCNIVYQKVEIGKPLDVKIDTKKGYFEEDVKEHLKEFIERLIKNSYINTNGNMSVETKHIAKEIFGERLI